MNKIEFNTEKLYQIKGNIVNGIVNGEPYICKENVCRRIKYATDTNLVLECGRKFIIDNDLEIEELNY